MTTEQEMRIKGIAIGEMMVAVEISSKEAGDGCPPDRVACVVMTLRIYSELNQTAFPSHQVVYRAFPCGLHS